MSEGSPIVWENLVLETRLVVAGRLKTRAGPTSCGAPFSSRGRPIAGLLEIFQTRENYENRKDCLSVPRRPYPDTRKLRLSFRDRIEPQQPSRWARTHSFPPP